MLPLRIALRFLRKSPVQTGLIVAGIAVGIAVQVFVGSLITSLQASLIERTIGSSPHVSLQAPKDGDPVQFSDAVKRVVKAESRVTVIVPERDVNVLFLKGTDKVPLSIKGGELADLNGIYRLRQRTIQGEPSLRAGEIMVGLDFARKYDVKPGDPAVVLLGANDQLTLKVSGIFDLGSAAANARTAFTGPELPRTALGQRADEYSVIAVQLTDPFASSAVAGDWKVRLSGVKVGDWQVDNKELLQALSSQSASSYMIQVFVLIAVALGIASTLAIAAVQKTKQIGILKALGMTDAKTAIIFLWQAAIMGVLGTGLGVGLGLALIAGFTFGTAKSGSGFPIIPQPSFIAISAGVGMLVALLSSIIPTRKTARLDPIEVIQNG
ncbi:MAG TPA: FtsX-like permease family protein [Coriobacteriia bacterium]